MPPRAHKLSAQRIRAFKKRLQEDKTKLHASIERMEARGDELVDAGPEEADFDDAASDAATETLNRGTDMALEDNLRTMLEEVEAALEKIEKGSYGVCDNCGVDIKIVRLERIPSATMCVECQERLERR